MISYFSEFETQGVNYGESTRLKDDKSMFKKDSLSSVGPSIYTQNTIKHINCNRCLSLSGPRPSQGTSSFGVSTFNDSGYYPTEESTNIENTLTGRNASRDGLKGGRVSYIDVKQLKKKLINNAICPDILNVRESRFDAPVKQFRELRINRFYDLNLPVEAVDNMYKIGSLSQLEAKDNYVEKKPYMLNN